MPALAGRDLPGAQAAPAQIAVVPLMDVRRGACGGLPAAEHTLGEVRGHIQVDHQIRRGQAQPPVLQVKQPRHKLPPLPHLQLGGLVHGVGGGVAVGQDQRAVFIVLAPVLLVGGVAVHREQGGGGVGVHIAGAVPQHTGQIQPGRLGKGVAVAGEVDLPKEDPLLPQPLGHHMGLGGLAGAVGTLKNDQPAPHVRSLFSRATWTKNRGSFIIRPTRLGFFSSR